MTSEATPKRDRGGAFVHANGIDIHYVERGSGEPLVLLHGGLVSTGPVWDGMPISYNSHIDRLAEHFRVIAPDTRGSGATVHSGGTASMAVLADDAIALMEALGLERPMLCGFSEGAQIGTIVAIREPERLRAFVNDAGFDVFNPHSPMFGMARMMLGGSPEATEANPDAAAAAFGQFMGPMFELVKADYDDAQGEGYWRRYIELLFPRWTRSPGYTFDDFRAITTPTLVLTGDRDMFCPVEDATTSYRSLPNGELAILANHDHSIGDAAVDASVEFLLRHAKG